MGNDDRFVVVVVDGDACDIGDPFTPSVRYDNLSWNESVELARLSFKQGFEIVVWKIDGKS